MKPNTFKTIKNWDENIIYKHISEELNSLCKIFNELKIKELSFIDIGGNVGKFYEQISKSFIVNKCIIVEASEILSEYMRKKFQNDSRVVIHNFGLSDTSGDFYFDDVGVTCIEENDIDLSEGEVNLGLSKKTDEPGSTKFLNADYFLREINEIPPKEISFIKIDTENRDYYILSSISNYLAEKQIKPIILFENNFNLAGQTVGWAREILSDFCKKCGYAEPSYMYSPNIFLIPL